MSTSATNTANKSSYSKYPDASPGKSQKQHKFESKLSAFYPDSKESVMEYIRIDAKNYNHASENLKNDKDIIHLVCELEPAMYGIMTGKAKNIAEKYLFENPKLKDWGLI